MGESNQAKNYFFSDNAPAQGENLYRLKMVDRDETFAYSRIQSVKVENSDALAIFPNPVTDRILLKDISNVNQVTLLDPSGRKVYQTEKIQSTGIDCKDFVAGNYIVMVARTNGTVSSHHILIRK
jgi:hypothetical protein